MRIRTLVIAGAAALAGLAVPQSASANPPQADDCTAVVEGVAIPGNLAGLAVATAQVVCGPAVVDLSLWGGHTTLSIVTQDSNGDDQFLCSQTHKEHTGVSVLVMADAIVCERTLPSNTPIYARLDWATFLDGSPGTYSVTTKWVQINPVGAG